MCECHINSFNVLDSLATLMTPTNINIPQELQAKFLRHLRPQITQTRDCRIPKRQTCCSYTQTRTKHTVSQK